MKIKQITVYECKDGHNHHSEEACLLCEERSDDSVAERERKKRQRWMSLGEEIVAMRDKGMTFKAISKELSIGMASVKAYKRRYEYMLLRYTPEEVREIYSK